MEAIRGSLGKAARFVRGLPPAYRYGALALAASIALLTASLISYVAVVDVVPVTGEAPPGTAEREVPLNLTSFFRARLAVPSCGVEFHLLTDSEYEAFLANRRLPPPTLDCNRTEALLRSRVGHMVTVYTAPSSAPNVPYEIIATFFGEGHPYAWLSVPGALLGIGSTIAIAMTMMNRQTAKLAGEFRNRRPQRKKKEKK